MCKSFLLMLAGGLLLVMANVPVSAHSTSINDSGYVTVSVPDLQQATTFFRDILDCEPLSTVAANEWADTAPAERTLRSKLPRTRLLLCDAGTVVELFDAHAMQSPSTAQHSTDHGNEPIQLSSDDVAHADQWLRREGVKVTGAPVTMTAGPHAGQTLVNFVTPWGLQMQLVGWNTSQVATAP